MARTFRRHRTAHPLSELNVTNLVDLAFVLLLIFMITTPLINQEQTIPVNLPVEAKSEQPKPDPETRFETVAIDRQGRYYLGGGNAPISLAEMSARFAAWGAETEKRRPVIRIRADLTLQWQQVVRLIEELKKHNLGRITFDTQTAG